MQCACPACGSTDIQAFYHQPNAPVHSVLVHHTRAEALTLPTGEIRLGFCRACGFIYNTTFDASLQDYAREYESTQGFSPTFNRFADELARTLIERFNLREKDIIEIGCGQGEFLNGLCQLGNNRGLGFDPAYRPGRVEIQPGTNVEFIRDYYSEKYADRRADAVLCKMTLEHIGPVYDFAAAIRRAVETNGDTLVFFQVPAVPRILAETAFWDIYYEHCSYFSPGSLARLFRRAGLNPLDVWSGYEGQYLMIAARPARGAAAPPLPLEEAPDQLYVQVQGFAERAAQAIAAWRARLARLHAAGRRTILWGGGSKAVAFLTALGEAAGIDYAVDVNPFKNHTFLAGSGLPVRSPAVLRRAPPDTVLLMNPIYEREVRQTLAQHGCTPQVYPVGS